MNIIDVSVKVLGIGKYLVANITFFHKFMSLEIHLNVILEVSRIKLSFAQRTANIER